MGSVNTIYFVGKTGNRRRRTEISGSSMTYRYDVNNLREIADVIWTLLTVIEDGGNREVQIITPKKSEVLHRKLARALRKKSQTKNALTFDFKTCPGKISYAPNI